MFSSTVTTDLDGSRLCDFMLGSTAFPTIPSLSQARKACRLGWVSVNGIMWELDANLSEVNLNKLMHT